MAHFLSDVFGALGLDQPDGKATQAGDVLGAMPCADTAAVLVIVPIEDIMAAVFDGPVATVDLEKALGVGLLRGAAGDAIGNLAGGLAGLFVDRDAFDGKDLADMREVQVVVKGGGRPDFTGFDAAVVGRVMRDKVRGLSVSEPKSDVIKECGMIGFDGEVVVGVAFFDQVVGEFALGEKRIGGDIFVMEIEAIEERDRHTDLVSLF